MSLRAFVLLLTFATPLLAQEMTALTALKLLPAEAAKNLTRIEGREGAPWPERWHFITHDAAAPLGLREFVVAGGKVAASRTLSQFADGAAAADVLGAEAVKFDSAAAAALAARYAAANGGQLATVHYELSRPAKDAAPAWRLSVQDAAGKPLGTLLLGAEKGEVLAHEGFPLEPPPVVAKPRVIAKPKPVATPRPTPRPAPRIANPFRKLFGN